MGMQLSSQHEYIATLLARGVQHNLVASAAGISAGRLTQLIQESQALQDKIAEHQAATLDEDIGREDKLQALSDSIVDGLPSLIEDSDSLRDNVNALRILEEMRLRRKGYAPATSTGIGAGVQLHLGAVLAAKIDVTVTPEKRIISLGGQIVAPMPRDKAEAYLEAYQDDHTDAARLVFADPDDI